jgi:hypothetical protein
MKTESDGCSDTRACPPEPTGPGPTCPFAWERTFGTGYERMGAMVRRTPAIVIVFGLLAAACGGGSTASSGAATPPTSSFSAQVGSTDLYTGAPQRVEVGVFSSTDVNGVQLLSFGQIKFAFSYLGTDGSATPVPGATITADYVGAPGTQTTGQGPALTSPGTARGVYEAPATFDRSGIWQVDVTADVADVGTQHLTAGPGLEVRRPCGVHPRRDLAELPEEHRERGGRGLALSRRRAAGQREPHGTLAVPDRR